jgi:hypothetical protein
LKGQQRYLIQLYRARAYANFSNKTWVKITYSGLFPNHVKATRTRRMRGTEYLAHIIEI